MPRSDSRIDLGRLVPRAPLPRTLGSFAIRSADEPVVGLHHRVGEEHLPLDGADRENREAAVVRELAEPVGEVALPLPAQPRDAMRAPEVLEAGPAAGWRRRNCLPASNCLSQTNRVTPTSAVSSSRCPRSRRSPGGTRSAMRASIRRSASTSASAQSHSTRRRGRQDGSRATAGGCGGGRFPMFLQVLVAQGVVPQQVRLASRQGEQGRPLPPSQDGSPCHSLSLGLQRAPRRNRLLPQELGGGRSVTGPAPTRVAAASSKGFGIKATRRGKGSSCFSGRGRNLPLTSRKLPPAPPSRGEDLLALLPQLPRTHDVAYLLTKQST